MWHEEGNTDAARAVNRGVLRVWLLMDNGYRCAGWCAYRECRASHAKRRHAHLPAEDPRRLVETSKRVERDHSGTRPDCGTHPRQWLGPHEVHELTRRHCQICPTPVSTYSERMRSNAKGRRRIAQDALTIKVRETWSPARAVPTSGPARSSWGGENKRSTPCSPIGAGGRWYPASQFQGRNAGSGPLLDFSGWRRNFPLPTTRLRGLPSTRTDPAFGKSGALRIPKA
jgi:hypothetical protein